MKIDDDDDDDNDGRLGTRKLKKKTKQRKGKEEKIFGQVIYMCIHTLYIYVCVDKNIGLYMCMF